MAIRTIETLVRQYPNKTGNEILDLFEQDKIAEEKRIQEANKKAHDFANDINTNGGYYKGSFGLDQYYFYNIFNVTVYPNGAVIGDVRKIVIFDRPNESFSAELKLSEFEDLSKYGLSLEKRSTEDEWNSIITNLLETRSKFWETINIDS